jgi:hypothetical protein
MWDGFDQQIQRDLATIRQLVGLRHRTPTEEWPLIFIEEHDLLLVLRAWPDGSLTCYATDQYSDAIRRNDLPPSR